MDKHSHWMELVSEVFDTNPRNGNRSETVWLPRPDLEGQLESELFTRGRHICVDGCSGSGKSSLVITTLLKRNIPYTTVQITRKMDWHGLCKQLIQKPTRSEREAKAGASAEWKGLFPTGKLEFSLGRKVDEKITHEYWEQVVTSASEHDIARAIADQNCVVLIDEFERAQPDLANSISEVCKILTQTYPSQMGKIVVLGADDVFKKLYDAYSTLDNRLVHLSIPTLPGPQASWKYLKLGFRKLGKFHPGNSKFSKPGDEKKAIEAIYLAADGLFKSLTELGMEICRSAGEHTQGVSLATIQKTCAAIEERNFGKYRTRFADMHRLGQSNPVTVAVLLRMNQLGLGKIHDRQEIEEALGEYGRGLVDDAILALWKEDFLVMTGESNQKLFIKNPSWAHTFRVYLSDPRKRKKLEAHLQKPIQFTLEIGVDWQNLETDGDTEDQDLIDKVLQRPSLL